MDERTAGAWPARPPRRRNDEARWNCPEQEALGQKNRAGGSRRALPAQQFGQIAEFRDIRFVEPSPCRDFREYLERKKGAVQPVGVHQASDGDQCGRTACVTPPAPALRPIQAGVARRVAESQQTFGQVGAEKEGPQNEESVSVNPDHLDERQYPGKRGARVSPHENHQVKRHREQREDLRRGQTGRS